MSRVVSALLPVLMILLGLSAGAQTTEPLPADSVDIPLADFIVKVDSVGTPHARRGSITPVDNDRSRPAGPTLHYYDRHGNRLPQPVLFEVETRDTVVSPRSPYPLWNGMTLGVEFLDPLLMACGQSYGSYGVTLSASLHNWFFPTVEVGLGQARHKPENGAYRFVSKPGPYVKLGINYNFLYKSNPAYQAFLGLRAGWSHVSYRLEGLPHQVAETDEEGNTTLVEAPPGPTIGGQKAHALFGEVFFGIKVRIAGPFSLGWGAGLRFPFKKSGGGESEAWFFPGLGGPKKFAPRFTAYFEL